MSKYVLAADPITPEASGVRHFFTDETGVIATALAVGRT